MFVRKKTFVNYLSAAKKIRLAALQNAQDKNPFY